MESEDLVEINLLKESLIKSYKENILKENILFSVAHGKGFFKSQQIHEKDLTVREKKEIAKDILEQNPKLFLQRYWKDIKVDDISYFDPLTHEYEVDYYLQQIRKFSSEKSRRAQCQNRRFEALKRMVKEGTYFSFEAMRERNPLLFEQLVGYYITDEKWSEIFKKKKSYTSFAGLLIECMNRKCVENLKRHQEEEETSMMEEEDSDDSEEEIPESQVPEAEKQLLLTEFINMMYENFLSGADENFDYSTIDENEEFDSVYEREIDEEEKYFDAD